MDAISDNPPRVVGAVVVENKPPVGENWKTKVHKIDQKKMVVKENTGLMVIMPRKEEESDESYYTRRLKASIDFVKKEREDEKIVAGYIPPHVKAPREYAFISEGPDGFPLPYRVQELVEGRRLKDVDKEELSPQNQKTLDDLVDASVRCYLATGKVIDLTGWSGARGISYRLLSNNLAHPFETSANILLTNDGDLALIDVKSSFPGGTLTRKLGRFIHFAAQYWEKIKRDQEKRK